MEAVSPLLLISDLGRPERFLNMLRVFKVTSPMSVGSWILVASERLRNRSGRPASHRHPATAEAARRAGLVRDRAAARHLHRRAAREHCDSGLERARDELPFVFGASACASAGAIAAIFTPTESAGPARRAAVLGSPLELGIVAAMERKLGFVGEVYNAGRSRNDTPKLSKGLVAAGAGLLALGGRRSRAAAAAGGALVLAGEVALRWSIFKAGFQSARDPKYTVVPQKARKAQREARLPNVG